MPTMSIRHTLPVAVAVSVYSIAAWVASAGIVKSLLSAHHPGVGAASGAAVETPRSALEASYQRTP